MPLSLEARMSEFARQGGGRPRTLGRTGFVAAVALAGAVAFCGCSAGEAEPVASTSHSAAAASTAAGEPTTSATNGGVRGSSTDLTSCGDGPVDDPLVSPVPVKLVAAFVCTYPYGPSDSGPHSPVPVPPSSLPALLDALSAADEPGAGASPCPDYADLPTAIFGVGGDGARYQLHIPVDSCGHYQSGVLRVLSEIDGAS